MGFATLNLEADDDADIEHAHRSRMHGACAYVRKTARDASDFSTLYRTVYHDSGVCINLLIQPRAHIARNFAQVR